MKDCVCGIKFIKPRKINKKFPQGSIEINHLALLRVSLQCIFRTYQIIFSPLGGPLLRPLKNRKIRIRDISILIKMDS